MTVTIILGKSDRPDSITPELWKLNGLFVSIKSIHEGFSAILTHVGTLIRLLNPYESQKPFMFNSFVFTLKFPINNKLS